MCQNCWTEYGSPSEITPAIRLTAAIIGELYEISSVGGNLHIVINDWNLDDSSVEWCKDRVLRIKKGIMEKYDDTDPEQLEIESRIINLLLPMTVSERGAVLALVDGYIE